MKLILKSFLTRFFLFISVIYLWWLFLLKSQGTSVEPHLKRQLDLAITSYARTFVKHLIDTKIMTSHQRRQAIRDAQARLVCYIRYGTWIAEGRGKSRYYHDEKCLEGWIPLELLDLEELTGLLCTLLSGKQVLFVGPHALYHAHTLLLDALAKRDKKRYSCKGPESCNHRFICGDSLDEESQSSPFSPRNETRPEKNSLLHLTRVSFSLSDTLYAVRDPQDDSVARPLVDSKTGIRAHNSLWLAASQKAHVVILNKGPRPAPAWTFDGGNGNWSFARDILQELNGPRERSLSASVITAALHAVYQIYLPELIRSMNALQQDTKSHKIFLGSWYQQPACTNAGLTSELRTTRLIWESNVKTHRQIDPWTLYYNTQGVYIIDRILPAILPYFNVTFVPMTVPLVPDDHGLKEPERIDQRKDCLRPSTDHPVGKAIQMALMKSLLYLFQNQ